ncbi:SDR family NAD(P)-dependent oxidoreductase [Streptomyces europaeiscabiei]|uniref:SDR family NAD(P)-dependent oxidoreductase n=1 Tax=Streptomyces europaeiscabiei TaxID=146819 RepID=UPI002E2AD452|nr:SDR family NAD(P)-dependent oxidoreductase [Streptomyces europaeiscabiei]
MTLTPDLTPGLDPTVAARLAAATRAVPGVRDAAVVVRQGARTVDSDRDSDGGGASAPSAEPTGAEPTGVAPTGVETDPAGEPSADRPSSETFGGELRIPDGAPMTLQEGVRQAAELAPEQGTLYLRKGSEPDLQTYAELLVEAERVLAGLRAAGLTPGDAALFQFEDHRAYMTAFWACVLGGFVPTPVAVATTYGSHNETTRKLHNAWRLLDRPVLLTDRATAPELAALRGLWEEPDLRILRVDELAGHERDSDWYPTTPDSPVINLLTSGSTGVPKCVRHTNASVAAREWAVIQARGYTGEDVSLIWMPLDHVTMVYYNVRDMFLRCRHVNGRIDDVLGDPLLWLDWIDRYGVTNTWAPNFAYNLVNECAEEIGRRAWDLSRMREFVNAGEPVVAATSHRFLELLAPHGLRADAMVPCWGMSETCSGVTYTRQSRDDRELGTVVVSQASLDGELIYRTSDRKGSDAVAFTEVGGPVPGVTIRVVDDQGRTLPRDRVGELQIRGVTMLRHYHGNAEANREAFTEDGWFRTGDLAFVRDGSLVIAGRKKDQIIVRGANFVAHELESVVEQVEGVRVTFSAAAGVREPGEGSDRLVIFFVPARWDAEALARTFQDVRAALVREAGIAPDVVVPVTDAEFPKTASGKIQRAALVADLRAGRFADRIADEEEDTEEAGTWFFRRQWSRLPAAQAPADSGSSRLVFSADCGTRVVFAEEGRLAALGLDDEPAVLVGRGRSFAEVDLDRYRVAPGDPEDLRRVLTDVTAHYGPIDSVVFAWPLEDKDAEPAARLTALSTQLAALTGVLDEFGAPLLLVLTEGAVHVRPGDRVDLGVCALPGLVRTAAAENPLITVRQLDLPADRAQWPRAVRTELADPTHAGVVAAREGLRWQPRLRAVHEETEDRAVPPLVAGGLYLVTGGLGGIASDLAGYLLAAYGVRLLLVGRSPAEGDKAARLKDLTDLGEVTYRQADITDRRQLESVVAAAEQRWGRPLDGVLHLAAADVSDQWTNLERHTLARESADGFRAQYAAKVAGTLALADVLESRPEASLVLFGSVNGEFGGHSFGAYSAANTFLVGFADHWHHERGRDVRCLAWSLWDDIGMSQGRSTAPARLRGFRAIDAERGLRCFLTATALPYPYQLIGLDARNPVIVGELAPDELSVREVLVAYTSDGADPAAVHAALAPALAELPFPVRLMEVTRIPRDVGGAIDTTQLLLDMAPRRASLGRRGHTAPEGELEQRIAAIWSDVLGQKTVGRDESFFDLGGNSLRATRLLARVGSELSVRLSTHELYDSPTVEGMAARVAAQTPTTAGADQ